MAISHAPAVAIPTPRTRRTGRRVLFFGTYDARRYPRVRVLQEGFAALGDEVLECNVPLRLDTAARVKMLRRPWLVPLLAAKLASTWIRLIARSRRCRGVDVVVVGYMGHFDVHLARLLWPRTPVALDHLVSARDTALDRRVSSRWLVRVLDWLDRVEPEYLPYLVACHDVCLGIFGTGPKALRVVPNKVFQGAAAGTAIVTSDTPPQRQELGNAAAYVPAGDASALAAELRKLAGDRDRLWELRVAAFGRANERFHPAAVVEALDARLPATAVVAEVRSVAA